MHSLVSHMRSSSSSGKTRLLGAEGGGVVSHSLMAERTESYFGAWSAVRTGAGGAFEDGEGRRKGVFRIVGAELLDGFSGFGAVSRAAGEVDLISGFT